MTGRADPWWTSAFSELRPEIERYVARRLPAASVQDVMSTVLEQLVEKTEAFATTRPSWLATCGEPAPGQVAEFKGLVWTMARMRMLDELRHVYVTSKAHDVVRRRESGVDLGAQLDARQMLALLGGYIDDLSVDDRHLLLSAVDGDSTENGAQSPAQRVKLHRIRRQLAEKLWQKMKPPTTEGKDRG